MYNGHSRVSRTTGCSQEPVRFDFESILKANKPEPKATLPQPKFQNKSPKRELFIKYYYQDGSPTYGNATRSYARAYGVSKASADSMGARLRKKIENSP